MAHSNKEDTFRCSACMETFETENEFKNHVRTRHALMFSLPNLQCSLCRTVCSSELEMHFHMATHTRKYRCSLCPEVFHIEFLLERHMQTHHCLPEKDALGSFKIDNLNNNMFDFNYAAGKKLYPFTSPTGHAKLFDPLHIQTSNSAVILKLPPPLYELYYNIGKSFSQQNLSKHFSSISKTFSEHFDNTQAFSKHFEHSSDIPNLLNIYKSDYASKAFFNRNPLAFLPPTPSESHNPPNEQPYAEKKTATETQITCNICERNDFLSEMEMISIKRSHTISKPLKLCPTVSNSTPQNFASM